MLLQIDATVAYGAGKAGTDLTQADLDDPNNVYNLYVHLGPAADADRVSQCGLRPGGACPGSGRLALLVTVNLDTKETRFAATLEEHRANVALLRQWQAENPDE